MFGGKRNESLTATAPSNAYRYTGAVLDSRTGFYYLRVMPSARSPPSSGSLAGAPRRARERYALGRKSGRR